MQPYGTVLTEILNLDATPFQKLLGRLNTAVHEKNYDDAPRAYMDMQKGDCTEALCQLLSCKDEKLPKETTIAFE